MMWTLTISSMLISAVLAISRWYQLSYPLRFLNRKAVEAALGVSCISLAAYFQWQLLLNNTKDNPMMFKMYMQSVDLVNTGSVNFYLPLSLAILLAFTSAIASATTVWIIVKLPTKVAPEIRSRRIRSSLKIVFLNAGNLVWIVSLMIKLAEKENIPLQIYLCILSIIQPTYNPLVYIVLTKKNLTNIKQ